MNYKIPLRLAMENAMNGNHAFTRNHPKPGETKHYFMKWADDPFSTASDAQIIDVPDDIDPEEFRKNGYQRPTQPSSLSGGSLLDNPSGYQSLLPENEGSLSETTNSLGGSMSSTRGLTDDSSNEISLGSLNSMSDIESSYPKYWETPEDGLEVYKTVLANEGDKKFKSQNILEYIDSAKRAYDYITKEKDVLSKNKNLTDKFKHAYLNCKGAQMGNGGSDMARVLSYGKELKDLLTGQNKLSESIADNYANLTGRLVGRNNPEGSCETLLEKYIKKYY